jgi:hypothetical protein
MAAKTVLSMEESMRLVEWGRKNTEYMTRNPRNNIRRKIKTDTGIDAGLTKIVELEKMFKIVKKHGGKRPAGKNYARLLLDLHTIAVAVHNLHRWSATLMNDDMTKVPYTPEGIRERVEMQAELGNSAEAVKHIIRNLHTLREQIKSQRPTNTSEGKEAAEKTG